MQDVANTFAEDIPAGPMARVLTKLLWLSILHNGSGDLPALTPRRVTEMRKLVRSWREPDAIDKLASLIMMTDGR